MNKTFINTLPFWQFNNLSGQQGIRHFVSGRDGGVSQNFSGGLNLSYKVGDDPELVLKNRSLVAKAFSIDTDKLVFPVQTHSNHIKIVKSSTKPDELEDTDAIITTEKGLMVAVMSADCVPVLFYDPKQSVVAAAHAGWRGTVGEIVRHTIAKMKNDFGTNPENIVAAIGPSICAEVYEVGEEVIQSVERVYGTKEGIISQEKNGKGFCNLWEANRIQLLRAGVKPENIEVAGLCTFKNSDEFFSHRKDGTRAGRFAAGIMLE